ncbi:MAG: dockerin type I repeat-containing protein [Oscillospiraceae bacterium]|nr:dockerin type I repeat-containing protein [Oscillospiraceae bacterium]
MKKSKKLLARIASVAASAIFCTGLVTSVPASSIYIEFDKSSDEYAEFMADYYEVDDSGLWESFNWIDNPNTPNPYTIYANKSGNGTYIYEEIQDNKYTFVVSKSIENYCNKVIEILGKYYTTYEFSINDYTFGDDSKCALFTVTDKNISPETPKKVREICSELKENGLIKDFIYYGDISSPTMIYCDYLTEYSGTDWEYDSESQKFVPVEKTELFAELEKYVEENGLDCSVVKVENTSAGDDQYYKYRVVPNTEITLEEHFALAKQICDGLGLIRPGTTPEDTTGSYYAITVDMFNAVYGDATNDSVIDLYDAIEISKSLIGMRNFTASEKIIADYDGNGTVDLYDAVGIAREIMNNK